MPLFPRLTVRRGMIALLSRLLLILSALCTVCAPAAHAEGGISIANAPTIAYGQQEFGNTTSGGRTEEGEECRYHSYWLLPVITGDTITMDWESQAQQTLLYLYKSGTSDFNLAQASPENNPQSQQLSSNDKGELTYVAPISGMMPIEFLYKDYEFFSTNVCSHNAGGPYSFTTYVRHAVQLGFSRRASVTHIGTLNVAVHTPDGGPISDPGLRVTIQLKGSHGWFSVGSAPAISGTASVHVNIPAHYRRRYVVLRAIAQGSLYVSAITPSVRVKVQ